jgi:hypothetical protein
MQILNCKTVYADAKSALGSNISALAIPNDTHQRGLTTKLIDIKGAANR